VAAVTRFCDFQPKQVPVGVGAVNQAGIIGDEPTRRTAGRIEK